MGVKLRFLNSVRRLLLGKFIMITYEFPINERIRTFLRLENLYNRAVIFVGQDSAETHHVALLTIFEILEVTGRTDLKSELLQELERQRLHLTEFKGNPSVEENLVAGLLEAIETAKTGLLNSTGKTGQEIRENEWLTSIRQRTSIPGGVCQFDLPSYHYWLNGSLDNRRRDLENWLAPFKPISTGVLVILKLLRQSGQTEQVTSTGGNFQKSLSGKTAHLIRVKIKYPTDLIPEVSANKYLLNIRFTIPGNLSRKPTQDNVEFELSFCNLL